MFSVTYQLKCYIIRHLGNYTTQMHNIYSLLIFAVFLLHVSVLHHQGELTCHILKTTFCYAAIICGYCSSYVVNTKKKQLAFTGFTIIVKMVDYCNFSKCRLYLLYL